MVLTQQELRPDEKVGEKTFPYHYGSHATEMTLKVIDEDGDVSIPLWFSRNQEHAPKPPGGKPTFPYHYGSHATITQHPLTETRMKVSIPLWFSRNEVITPPDHKAPQFPYHYGSHATRMVDHVDGDDCCFHTTMVLTQLVDENGEYVMISEFPYHYGSHATSNTHQDGGESRAFPYHYGSHATR